ncbi:polyphosphate kinase 1 [candidate division KSB1 bacterium]|nr:polyphosphate kinase 1 [candidate division KSB1 bacterium]
MSANKNEKKFVNREISWLSFNERVLQEASDKSVPLIERIKFLGIYSSNLDEFFSVRVGTIKRMHDAGIKAKSILYGTPREILNEIQRIVIIQRDKFENIFTDITKELESKHIFFVNEMQLNREQSEFVKNYFDAEVRPRLVPLMLNYIPTFPYLKNQVIYLAVYLWRSTAEEKPLYSLIELPANILPRFILLPNINKRRYIIMLDDIIRFGLKDIFANFQHERIEAFTIKLTRDAELEIDDDVRKSFFEKISKSLKQRKMGQPVRFVYDRNIPRDLLDFILRSLELSDFDNLIPGGRYHNARDFIKFPQMQLNLPSYKIKNNIMHRTIKQHNSIFDAIKENDILLYYPYHSFHHIIDLLREAAIDPKVKRIKMTLYRLARNSSIINALINASRNGKDVTVVIELQARFDEEANIEWTQKLEDYNVRILDGVPGLKVHSKLCLIDRIEDEGMIQYAYIGTGNFNESTAKIYADHGLLTVDNQITGEVHRLFKFLENNYKTYNYKHLLVAPLNMRTKLNFLIKNEMKNAKAGKQAYIYVKINSLVDTKIMEKLYKASQAGVKIKMIVRGICSLIPGVQGLSENIEIISIVDKYLEHSRIYIFCNDGNELFYISSADLMVRNLDNRVEVAAPIYDPMIQQELKELFNIQFKDNTKARIINKSRDNQYQKTKSLRKCRAQEDIYTFLEKLNSTPAKT